MKVKTIFILFFQIILFLFQKIKAQASTLDKIPGKYISDKNFIPMTLQTPTQNTKLFAAPKGHGNTCTLTNPCTLSTGISRLKEGYTLYLHEENIMLEKILLLRKKVNLQVILLYPLFQGKEQLLLLNVVKIVERHVIKLLYLILKQIHLI